jgi:TolB-like protein/DNA-binding SARP family transcriptional activator
MRQEGMFELALLGRLDLRDAAGTEVQQLLGRPKLVALLAYLAAARPYGFHRRDRIVAVFWPEQDQQRARNALRQAVHHLRAALGPDVLRTRGDEELAVDHAIVRCDVISFADLLAAGQTVEALELVQGDLLPAFHLSDVREFERWLDEEREHVRRQAASAARKLADVEEADGDLAGAAHWIRRALQLAPYEEESLSLLLGLLDRTGDRAGAVREYEAFARRLDQDLGVEPAPETQALLDSVRTRNEVVTASAGRAAVTPEPPPATGETDPPIAREQPQAPTPPSRSRILAIAVAAIAVAAVSWALWPESPDISAINTPEPHLALAVLPLENFSGDPDQEYFADGMTEEIIGELGRIAELRVISRTSVMQFKGADLPLQTIADSLGATHVLEGSVMREGDRIRIRAQLMAVYPEDHLWTEAFVRDAQDVLALQRDIAQAVAGTLRGVLVQESEPLTRDPRRVRPDVYEAYLRGRHRTSRLDNFGAMREFERAIALDSTFAPAWASLAGAIGGLRGFPPPDVPVDTGWTLASQQEAAARRAIALDSTLAAGHGELAGYLVTSGFPPFQRNLLEQAEREIQRALQLNPGAPGMRGSYAEVLSWIYGRHDEAITQARIALDLDPLSAGRQAGLGNRLLEAGRVDEAIAQYRFALEWHPGHGTALEGLGIAYVQLGKFDDAVAAMRQHGDRMNLAWALAMAGQEEEARRIVEERTANTRVLHYVELAAVFAALGDLDRAFEYLEEAYRQRIIWIVFIRHPMFAPLRGDPRYDDLVRRIGFPEPE